MGAPLHSHQWEPAAGRRSGAGLGAAGIEACSPCGGTGGNVGASVYDCLVAASTGWVSGSRHVYAADQSAALRLAAGVGPAGGKPRRVQWALGRQWPGTDSGEACGGGSGSGGTVWLCRGAAGPPGFAPALLLIPCLCAVGGDDVLPCQQRAHRKRPAGKHILARPGPACLGSLAGRDPAPAGSGRALVASVAGVTGVWALFWDLRLFSTRLTKSTNPSGLVTVGVLRSLNPEVKLITAQAIGWK